MRPVRPAVLLCALAVAATAHPVLSAPKGPRVLALRKISTPIAGARCDQAGAETPRIAVNPRDPRHQLVTWQNGGLRGSFVSVTQDGGRTWRGAELPGIVECSGGGTGFSVDAYAAIGADGMQYVTSGYVSENTVQLTDNDGYRTLLSRAPRGGAWMAPVNVDPGAGNQRAPVVVDPRDPRIVRVWTEQGGWAVVTYANGGPTSAHLVTSRDRGATFGPPTVVAEQPPPWRHIVVTGGFAQTRVRGVDVLVGGIVKGDLVDFGSQVPFAALGQPTSVGFALSAVSSRDGGKTFAAEVPLFTNTGPLTTTSEASCCIPSMAANATGVVAVASADPTGVRLGITRDGGTTWDTSKTIKVAHGALEPEVAVLADGRLAVFYYDRADDGTTTPYLTVVDGAKQTTIRLADSFDITAITTGGTDTGPIGPMQGIAAVPGGVVISMTLGGRYAATGDESVYWAHVAVPR